AGVTSTTTADLAVTSTPSATSVAPGAPLTWTIVATNAGPDAASGAHVDSTFPAALTGVTWTCTATTGSSCPTSSGTGAISAPATLGAGGSGPFPASGTVAASAAGAVVNATSIRPPPGVVDPVSANNLASSSVIVVAPPTAPTPSTPPPPPPTPPPPTVPPPPTLPPAPPLPPFAGGDVVCSPGGSGRL